MSTSQIVDLGTAVVGIGNMVTMESHVAAVKAAERNLIRKMNDALEKRDWCPCCGYDGLWPPGESGKHGWEKFLYSEVLSPAL